VNFTAECWIYVNSTPGAGAGIFEYASASGSSNETWYAFLNGTTLAFGWYNTAGGANQITSTVALNTWQHLAFSLDGSTIRSFINGVVTSASYTGTPRLISGSKLLIGLNPSFSGIAGPNAYITNVRIVSGQALYTTSFTPPTGPLQPIQGVTQDGKPYGTVLLLRNAPAPGRVLTSKFGGANSGQVLSFPPAAMTSYSTALNAGYGQGVYVASASNDVTWAAWRAFDKTVDTIWQVGTGLYTLNTPYSGATKTVDISGNSYAGEWLQIQNPSSIVLSNYTIYGVSTNMPTIWYILGSRDGTSWSLVDQRNFNSWSGYSTFTVGSSTAFAYFRFVLNQSNGTQPAIYEWTLNGSIEGPSVSADGRLGVGVSNPVQALEVAGSALIYGSCTTNGKIISGPDYSSFTGDPYTQGAGFTAINLFAAAAGAAKTEIGYFSRGGGITTFQVGPAGDGAYSTYVYTWACNKGQFGPAQIAFTNRETLQNGSANPFTLEFATTNNGNHGRLYIQVNVVGSVGAKVWVSVTSSGGVFEKTASNKWW
jgi:hypothetical protein